MADLLQSPDHPRIRVGRAVALLASAAALTVSACSVSVNGGSKPEVRSQAPTDTSTSSPEGSETATEAAPPSPGAEAITVEKCEAFAAGPWTSIAHSADPIADVREGRVPASPDGGHDRAPDQLTEISHIDQYQDTSTFTNPDAVYRAWQEAGFVEAIEARWGFGNNFAAITVVQFADAAGAQDALSAHLTDYCQKAVHATVRADGAGLTIQRESGAVRTIFLMDDIEVSVFVCSCFAATPAGRTQALKGWADETRLVLGPDNPNS